MLARRVRAYRGSIVSIWKRDTVPECRGASEEHRMILADTRGRLTGADLELVMLVLSNGSASRRASLERRLVAEGPDVLLDTPGLVERLLALRTLVVPSQLLLFYVLVRHALLRSGIDDRDLADYLASMLSTFGQRDRAWRIDWNDDHQHHYLIDIVSDLEATQGNRQFKVMAHLGNYALWLAGVFPDYIAARQRRKGGPDVSYYESLGQRGYRLAARHELADRLGLDRVFDVAADRFSALRSAFNELSAQLHFPGRLAPGLDPLH
jgi:hypothetical protein